MDRKNAVKKNINKFGQDISIIIPSQNNKVIKSKAFIQPLRQINKSYQWANYLDSGFIDLSNYIYIGPHDLRIDTFPDDTILESDYQKYFILKSNTVNIQNEIIYIWAVLQIYVPPQP